MSSLATGWSWQVIAWAMLPGLMNLKRMSASGGMESRIELVVRRLAGGAAIRPAVEAAVTEFIDSIGYSVVDAGPLADSWRQATGTPVWGTPYGPYSNEKGQPAGEDAIRAALATPTR